MVISTASKVKTFYQFSKFLEANDEKSDQLNFTYNDYIFPEFFKQIYCADS